MRAADADLLVIPGLGGSGPEHWQTRWEQKLSTARRVEQRDWTNPVMAEWTEAILAAVETSQRPVILVAHSLGVVAAVHVAPRLTAGVKGAFLVAPPSEDGIAEISEIDPGFRPYPRKRLPFPAVLVASRADPYGTYTQTESYAQDWGAKLIDAGDAGHLNDESGHGPWPEGLLQFAAFMKRL